MPRAAINVSTCYSASGVDVPWSSYRDVYGDWGTQQTQLSPGFIFDCAAVPSSANNASPTVIFASDRGVLIQNSSWADYKVVNFGTHSATGDLHDPRADVMSVAWKDHTTWLAGRKDGLVMMGDLRAPESVVGRLQTGRGGASRVAVVGRGIDWAVLAWGLQSAGVYDLRFCRPEKMSRNNNVAKEFSSKVHTATGSTHSKQSSSLKNKRRNGGRHDTDDKSKTQPLGQFDIPLGCQQQNYGMGWAYDPEMGIVASAYPTYLGRTKIALWDVSTGRRLTLQTRLADMEYENRVTCMQFVDLERPVSMPVDGDGFGSGAKSLVVSCSGSLGAWTV